MRKLSVELKLENPCSEDWGSMTPVRGGRFCDSCRKTVVDMTAWTEQDLVSYFNSNRENVCGQFHEHQLNRRMDDHEPPPRRKPAYERTLALILSFFTLQGASAQEAGKPVMSRELAAGQKPDAVTIRGRVTDAASRPLAEVQIVFNGRSYRSNADGRYEIVLAPGEVAGGIITFRYEGLTPEVRSYHRSMQSTSYDVQMGKPSGGRIHGGMPTLSFRWPDGDRKNFVTVTGKTLDSATKKILDGFAFVMQSHPFLGTVLQSYFSRDPRQALRRALMVKEYLVEEVGIDESRFTIAEPKRSGSAKEKFQVCFLTR